MGVAADDALGLASGARGEMSIAFSIEIVLSVVSHCQAMKGTMHQVDVAVDDSLGLAHGARGVILESGGNVLRLLPSHANGSSGATFSCN